MYSRTCRCDRQSKHFHASPVVLPRDAGTLECVSRQQRAVSMDARRPHPAGGFMKSASRGSYQGVLQILQFNWRFYASTLVVAGGGLLALPYLPVPMQLHALFAAGLFAAILWMCASLAV